jgi:signal transduction histidine kinase
MRLRLVLSFILIVLVSVTGVLFIARQGLASEVRSFMFHGGMTDASRLVATLEDYYQAHNSWQGVETLLRFTDEQGHGMGGSGRQGMMQTMMSQNLSLADAQGNWVADSNGPQSSGQMTEDEKAVAITLHVQNQTVGYLLAEGGMSFNRADESLLVSRLTRAALLAGLAAGLFSLLLALVLAYTLIRPVRELTMAAELLGQGDLSQRVRISGDDDLATLGKTFNHMAGALQKVAENRRAMTADIAHELRNPLAVQLANLEALQDGLYPLTPLSLAPILEQNHLLTRLVDDLRTLALADSGELKLERIPTDLPALVTRVVERFKAQATVRQIGIRIMGVGMQGDSGGGVPGGMQAEAHGNHPGWEVMVDPMRVEQILNNLLSNALRYTTEGGKIDIGLSRAPDAIQLTVHDNGPGIPVKALPYVFERFYRADRSRSRAEGGAGLGLAIARHLAEAHGGSLSAANDPDGGALFTLSFPIETQ